MANYCLAIGVGEYSDTVLKNAERPLECGPNSAIQFSEALKRRLSNCESLVLTDADAKAVNITELFESVLPTNSYETFVFYFCGHGRTNEIILASNHPVAVVSSDSIIKYLKSIKAQNIVVILDCCFAGSMAAKLTQHIDADISVFAATSEEDFAWENEDNKLTYFTDALCHVLDDKNIELGRDIFSNTFNEISQRVTAQVLLEKDGSRQVPKVHNSKLMSDKTPSLWHLVNHRVRLALASVTGFVVLIAVLLMLTTYRVGIDPTGRITVYYGPKFLSFLNYGPLKTRLTTQIKIGSLQDSKIAKEITAEKLGGIWTKKDKNSVDKWFADISAGLPINIRNRQAVMTGLVPSMGAAEYPLSERLFADYFKGNGAYPQDQFKSRVMNANNGKSINCGESDNVTYLDFNITQNLIYGQQSLINTIIMKDWITFDFLADQTAKREKDDADYGITYGWGASREPSHFRGEGFFMAAQAMKLKSLRSGNELPLAKLETFISDLRKEGGGCELSANIWAAAFEIGDIDQLESSLWQHHFRRESARQETYGAVSTMLEENLLGGENVGSDNPALNSFDPFFGFEYLASAGVLGRTQVNKTHWEKFYTAQINYDDNQQINYDDNDDNDDNDDAWRNESMFSLLGERAQLPQIIIEKLIDNCNFHRYFNNPYDGSSNLSNTYILANQAIYFTEVQFELVTDCLMDLESIYATMVAKAPSSTQSPTVMARNNDKSRYYPIFQLDELWGLMSMGGDIPTPIAQRIVQRPGYEWRQFPSYGNRGMLIFPADRPGVASRYLAAARYGLNNDLPDETFKALHSFATKMVNGENIVPQVYKSAEFSTKYKDYNFQQHIVFLALGKHYYGKTNIKNLVPKIADRIHNSADNGRQLSLELFVASIWLVHLDQVHHNQLEEQLLELWRTEKRSHKKLNFGNLLVYFKTNIFIYFTREATLLRE